MSNIDLEFQQKIMYKLGSIETALQTIIEHQKEQNGRTSQNENNYRQLRLEYNETRTTLKVWAGIVAAIVSLMATVAMAAVSNIIKGIF